MTDVINQEFALILKENNFSVSSLQPTADNFEVALVESNEIKNIIFDLKTNKKCLFNLLFSISGTDFPEYFEIMYHLYSSNSSKNLIIKARLDKNNPEIESISSVHSSANWNEREIYDLLGIKFINHPDLRRILLPDDWKGHPLRKNYINNDERLVWNER